MRLALLVFCALALASAQDQPEGTEFRFGTTVVIPTGLQGKIYHIGEFSKKLPSYLGTKKPVGTIYTTSLNIPKTNFMTGFPGVTKRTEWFAIDYTGKFWVQKAGRYNFVLTSDDGSKLYIDNELLIDNDGIHAVITKEGAVNLAEGVHTIRVSYFQGPKYELALVLQVEAPFMPRRVFNTDDYKPPSTVESLPSK